MAGSLSIRAEGAEGLGPWTVWPAGEPLPSGAVQEGRSYLFELTAVEDPFETRLLIDDQPLDALLPRRKRTALWRWSPGFHAGTAEAILRIPGSGSHRFELVTDPDLRKLTRDDFDTMVQEILEDTFALFSLSAFRTGIASRSGTRPPPLARLEFLRSRIAEIEETVHAILAAPRRVLRAHENLVPHHRARGVTGPEILRSFRTGSVLRQGPDGPRLPPILQGMLPGRIRVRDRRRTADTEEHRQIKAALAAWAAWLVGVADILAASSASGADEEVRNARSSWSKRAQVLAHRLWELHDHPLFVEVSAPAGPLVLTSLLRHDPKYRRFLRLHQQMRLGLASVFGDFLDMPLARTFELYELWCFLRLVRAAAEEYGVEDIDVDDLFLRGDDSSVTIAAGACSVRLRNGLTLLFKREYREFWLERDGVGSFSRHMIPDLVLAPPRPAGPDHRRLIILDAKYRIDQGLTAGLSSIHAYRDALVEEAGTGSVRGVVAAAYLLSPAPPDLRPGYRDTPLPGRLFHPEYRRSFRFGAAALAPGMSLADLRRALTTILADATSDDQWP